MKVLITANSHPDYDRVGVLTGHIPSEALGNLVEDANKGKTLYSIEFANGQRGTAFEDEFKVVKQQD